MLSYLRKCWLSLTAIFILCMGIPAVASASCANPTTPAETIQCGVKSAGGPSNPDTAGSKVHSTLSQVINILSLVIGIIAVIVIIIAGLTYITSGGNEQKVSSAKSSITYAVVGLIIVLFSQIIVRFVINKFK